MKIGKKNLIFGIGAILLLLVGFILGRGSIGIKLPIKPTPTATFLPTSLLSLTETPPSIFTPEIFKVTRVIDGDTIEIEGGKHVRYIGIDTPETVDPRKPIQCFGIEASKKNKEMVEGKNVRLEKDITESDKYGRLLRYVWVEGPSTRASTERFDRPELTAEGLSQKSSGQALFVNLELVKQGFATSYSLPPDIKYQKEILAAEREAREANRGLWGSCPPVSPTAGVQETTEGGCDIKGNISASGEKIYHLPECGSYSKTKIDESRGERWFCSEEEAKTLGWRKALNCP